ncbi:Oidioi.mRNA.OKI2018_I69.chr1.g2170.t3.cds [Oikopleura dioica]|uniref:Oidioi.mRNA.OKI2018_I69.chr1.g2170.t3.cds n=1 Tax=Oikopleura dioica TaxID=34765 RepID=A0ABN7SQA0_OIKDI|nr:Oidioi.mRNA.OKI2018_I69.chr1.g2170.t3.cds [Oikopleura dioica]
MTRRSRRQREVGLKSEIKTAYAPPRISHAPEVAHNLSVRCFKYDPSIPNPIVLTKPLKPRAVSSSEDEDELEAVYPGPICISCSGVDNDPLIWCSGCAEPYHYECAKGYPKEKYGQTYRWLCLDCRQSCVSCSYPVLTISTFNCKTCWKIIHRRCIDPQLRSEFRQNGWTCSECLRPNHEEPPRSTCELCLSDPLPNCQPSYQCDRCRTSVKSCCLDLSDDILHFYDNFAQRQTFLCENCDASISWKNHLLCAWRRSLLQILSPLSQLAKSGHSEISEIQRNIDKFDSIEDFAKKIKELRRLEKFRSDEIQRKFEHSKNVLEEIFPKYDAQVAALPETEFPPEFTFHLRKAPEIPQYQTSLYRSPACCLCTAKPSYARLIYLGQDEWAHAACVLWAGRLANTKGNYSPMIRGYSHGIGPSASREEDSCRHCGYSIRTAISVKCCKEGCNLVMHFFCARLTGWLVMDKMSSLCGRHKPRCESKKNMVLEASLARKQSTEQGAETPNLLADLIRQEMPSQDQNVPPSDVKPVTQQTDAGKTVVTPGITPAPKTGKPSSFDRQTSPVKVAPILSNGNLKPKSPSSGGKPQAFQQMMTSPPPLIVGKKAPLAQSAENSTLKELLRASPSKSTPVPASPLQLYTSPKPMQKLISPPKNQPTQRLQIIPLESQVNSKAMASNIMTKKPELQQFGQDKLSQLIETLFNEGPSSTPTSVNHFSTNLKESSASTSSNLLPSSSTSSITTQPQNPPNLTPKPMPMLNKSPIQGVPIQNSEKVMPQLQRNAPPPPLQQIPGTQIASKVQPSIQPETQVPQTDGLIDIDQMSPGMISENNEEDSDFDISDNESANAKVPEASDEIKPRPKKPRAAYGSLKKKKITLEEVFTDVENMLLRKGRARPDHNDQAHHHKSKWAHGIRPEDAYIALGGLSVKNLGKIHPECTQRYKEALCPEGYEAIRWFWSSKNPGNLTKYILNVSIQYDPLPEAVYVNETIVHEPDLIIPPEEDISEASTPITCEAINYTFDEWPEWEEVDMEEIAPPPKYFQRKRSADEGSAQMVPEKRGRRGRQKIVKKEVLETDDEDTEDMLNRRSVRVWANKIKKEFVEEVVIPEELDGFKVPTDDEDDLEEVETTDPMDTSFELVPKKQAAQPSKPLRVQSKRMSKFKNAPKRTTRGRGRRGKKNEDFSDEENERDDEELHEVELIIDDFEGRSPDSDRPNNVEMMSLSDVRTHLRSDDEDEDDIIRRRSRRMKLTSLDSDSESDEKTSPKSEPLVENTQELSPLESLETITLDTESREVITIVDSPEELKIEQPEVTEAETVQEGPQYEAGVLKTVMENVDPETLLQERNDSPSPEEPQMVSDESPQPSSEVGVQTPPGAVGKEEEEEPDTVETRDNEPTSAEILGETGTSIAELDQEQPKSPSVDFDTREDLKTPNDDPSETSVDKDEVAAEDQKEEPEAIEQSDPSVDDDQIEEEIESSETSSEKEASRRDSASPDAEDNWSPSSEPENDMEDMFRIEEHHEMDDEESEKSSELLAKELTQSFDCEKTDKDIEKILLHMKVNHPYHYAALITVKHSKVHKSCDTCGFIFMCKATFDSHLELSLCKRNLAYLKRYNEPEKFDELELEVIENEYQWSYPKRKVSKRRTPTKPKKPVSPPKQTRRCQKKAENLKTRSGRRVKVPQLDGNADSSDESSSRSGMEVDLPQTDGLNDAPRQPQVPPMYHQQMAQNQHQPNGNTHSRPTVIPILMPPAPGQSLEQTLASPVFRMQPVMQQTNYIHVAQGGTVILPGGANQQNQVTHQQDNQASSTQQSNVQRIGSSQSGHSAPPGYYQVVNPQGEVIGQKPMMQQRQQPQVQYHQAHQRQPQQQHGQNFQPVTSQIASHFPIFLTPGNSQGQPMNVQRVVTPSPMPQRMGSSTPHGYPQAPTPTQRLTATPFDNREHMLSTPLGTLGAPTPTPSYGIDQRMLEQQRLQEHRQRQQRALEEQRHREMQARVEEQHRREEEERKRQEMLRKQREEEERRRLEEEKRKREEQKRQELLRKQQEERRLAEEQHRKRIEHERMMQQQQEHQRLLMQQQQSQQFRGHQQHQGLLHRQMSPGLHSPPQQPFHSQNRSPGSAHNLQSPPQNFQSPPQYQNQPISTPQQRQQSTQQQPPQAQQFVQAPNQQFFHNGQRFIRIQTHPQQAPTPTYINSNQRFVIANQPVQQQKPQQTMMSNFQQRPVASSPVNQNSQIASFANQQVLQQPKPPQYQDVQRPSSSTQAPPQRYFNVGRSPKIDEYRLQQIKNDLKSPINAPKNIVVKAEPPPTYQERPQQQAPRHQTNVYVKGEPRDESYHKKVIKEAIKTQSELNKRQSKSPVRSQQPGPQAAVFGNQQYRIAPGAGPLPGLSTQQHRPNILQQPRGQPMRAQQQHVFSAYNPENGTFTIQPQMTLAPRPAQIVPANQSQRVPPQSDSSTSARKPWDLDLQPPRRQSGIEVVGRSPVRQQQSRPQQFQRYQVGTILPNNQGLKPGLNLINGQLIEVRNGPMPITGRQLCMDPSSFSIIKEEPKPIPFKQEPKQPKAPKQKPLIWDPIVLEESLVQGSVEDGHDDDFDGSILLDRLMVEEKANELKIVERPETPDAVDEVEEYNLMFSIVSEDGVRKSGKDLESLWNEIIDELPTSGRLPGSAPKATRPDVFAAFGFSKDMVRYLLEQLPLADSIPGAYKAVHFPRDEKSISVTRNSKGCWRAQGWSGKRNPSDMFSFLNSKHRSGLTHDPNFRPTLETDLPLTMRFRKMVETSRNSLQVLPSAIHGRGLFARRPYEPGELVIEYSGTVIRGELCDMREKYYDDRGIGTYMFRVDDDFVVDATMEGGRARFINHSCGPNCLSKIITVDSRKHICIIAGRFIDFGEELTYDYKFDRDLGSERIQCGCQAPNCRRFMN